MAREAFVDTSGFYALLVKRDGGHGAATRHLEAGRQARRQFVTTDYVLDETATLLKARGHTRLLRPFFQTVINSKACRIEWTDAGRFEAAMDLFLKHLDLRWSFTDCVSFRVMKELRIREALTKDRHFEQAGFVALLRNLT